MSARTPLPTVNERDTENVSMKSPINSVEVGWDCFVFHSLYLIGCLFTLNFKACIALHMLIKLPTGLWSGFIQLWHYVNLWILHWSVGVTEQTSRCDSHAQLHSAKKTKSPSCHDMRHPVTIFPTHLCRLTMFPTEW